MQPGHYGSHIKTVIVSVRDEVQTFFTLEVNQVNMWAADMD